MPYLNCPECYYRVHSAMAHELDGEASCPRCSRLGRLVAMYSTQLGLKPKRDDLVAVGGDPARPDVIHPPRVV